MDFKIKPYAHQIEAIRLAMGKPDVGLLWGMGAGKTGATVNILRMRYANEKRLMRTLIVSPLVTLQNWKKEIHMHSKIADRDVIVLAGGSKKILSTLISATYDEAQQMLFYPKILIINYDAVRNAQVLKALLQYCPEIVVADESQRIKAHKAAQSKAVVALGDTAKYRIILSGTPILNKPFDVYNQFRFLDRGQTFGRNVSVFMATYMVDANAAWSGRESHFAKYELNPHKAAELTEKISAKCYKITTAEALPDLPPLIKKEIVLEMPPLMKKYYETMARDFITFVEEKGKVNTNKAVVAQTAMTKALRLLQIASGIMSHDEGETDIEDNPKVDATRDLLQEIVIENNNKCILWCCFKSNYRILASLCDAMAINYCMLTGEQSLKEKNASMDAFEKDPSMKVIIANRRAGGLGINLIQGKYSIVFSRNFSLEDELQSEARNYRGGSQIHDSVIKIDLVFNNTIEPLVLSALKNKMNLAEKILDLSHDMLYRDTYKQEEIKWN